MFHYILFFVSFLTKYPMEMSAAKPIICSFTKIGFNCEHLPGPFSMFLEYLRVKLLFFFKYLRRFRCKPNNIGLNLFSGIINCLAMLDFLVSTFLMTRRYFYQLALFVISFMNFHFFDRNIYPSLN